MASWGSDGVGRLGIQPEVGMGFGSGGSGLGPSGGGTGGSTGTGWGFSFSTMTDSTCNRGPIDTGGIDVVNVWYTIIVGVD